MPFRFKMEVLLKMRRQDEREAQMILGKLRQEEHAMELRLSEIGSERKSWMDAYNVAGKKTDLERELVLIERYLIALENDARFVSQGLRELQKRIDDAANVVREAYKARRQMERVREMMKDKYNEEMQRSENREMSEIALNMHRSKQALEGEML